MRSQLLENPDLRVAEAANAGGELTPFEARLAVTVTNPHQS